MKKYALLAFTLLLLVLGSLFVGPVDLNFFSGLSPTDQLVLWQLRLPRTMTALWVGASLGLAGALLQTLLRNPLAEPYTLGLSGGASFGAVVAITLGLNPLQFSMPLLATLMCLLTALLILSLSKSVALTQSKTLILTGVMISLFFGSLVVVLLSVLEAKEMQTAFFWMMGQVGTERDQNWPTVAIIFSLSLAWALANRINLDRLLLGESVAEGLGTSVNSMTKQIIAVVSIVVASCVSVSGLIGFIGLLAPHLTKLIFRSHRHLHFLVGSALTGALLLLLSDVLARILGGEKEIPTGGLVALLGAPVLIYLLQKRGDHVAN